MRILYAAAELAPLVRVGGLGEVSGGLTKALRAAGVDVQVVLPDYSGTPLADETVETLDVPGWVGGATARTGTLEGFGQLTLVDVPDIRRAGAYGDPGGDSYWDNDRRFFRFSAAVAELTRRSQPDVLHANDWHTAPALAWSPAEVGTVVSIHNLAYQGDSDRGWLHVFGDRSYAYDRRGRCNPLAGALILADRIIAVSPTYATEILTEPMGCGLTDILGARAASGAVVGIVNGIEADEWNPETDSLIAAPFSATKRTGKELCRAALLDTVGLQDLGGPLFGFVSRLVDQKGVEFIVEAARYLRSVNGQLVVLGSGDRALADQLYSATTEQPDRVAFSEGFSLPLSHQIFAGVDCYLMPSRFEPCGLAQMQAMAYGTIPVVTDVGGLHDTVIDPLDEPDTWTGFVSADVSTAGLVDAMHRATAAFRNKVVWRAAQRRGMTADWSWRQPAQRYIELYKGLDD